MNNDNLLQLEGAIESVVFRNDENGYTVIELADGDDYLIYKSSQLRQTVCRADLRNQQTYRGG